MTLFSGHDLASAIFKKNGHKLEENSSMANNTSVLNTKHFVCPPSSSTSLDRSFPVLYYALFSPFSFQDILNIVIFRVHGGIGWRIWPQGHSFSLSLSLSLSLRSKKYLSEFKICWGINGKL